MDVERRFPARRQSIPRGLAGLERAAELRLDPNVRLPRFRRADHGPLAARCE